jgi:hypothetical protein
MSPRSRRVSRDSIRFWKLAILVCIVAALAIFGVRMVVNTMQQDAAGVGSLRQLPDPGRNVAPPVPSR